MMQIEPIEGPILTTSDEVLAAMRKVNTGVESEHAEFTANASVLPAAFVASWDAFRAEWKTFYVANQSGALMYVTGTGSLMRTIDDYAARLLAWHVALSKMPGVKLSQPAPTGPTPKPAGTPWGTIAVSTAVVVGSIAVIWGLVELSPFLPKRKESAS